MELPEQQPQQRADDPYHAVWQMSEVAAASGGKRRTELRILPGLIAAVVVLLPFAILAGFLWLKWDATAGGWVVALIGLAGAFSMGAFVAADRS
ncbi:MAG TPA: hypothetical protein VFV67_15820 [Actinophytocola sp.]|uniref:hypothetical protein n=1 Tax=Actinophytocola sp. TaxID=1872138 RepID=UPI002DB96136|nr:hypothetical protein [Actinophytocola sp.]HEU5472120.1 hypothetical protein [Actinophytocola sp.]